MKPALNDLIPQFERSYGRHVTVSYASASILLKEIGAGKTADLAILYPQHAKLAFGVIVRKGAAKPDVGTVHALKQTLMNAKSIASGDPENSASGNYFANLVERLQIGDAVKPKIRTFSSGAAAIEAVANGEAELAVWVISSAYEPGTELAGTLPAQAKKLNAYAAGILTNSNQIQAAKALLSFISSPNSLAVLHSKGFDPP